MHIEILDNEMPFQEIPLKPIKMTNAETSRFDSETNKLVVKGVIEEATHVKGEYFLFFFLRKRKMVLFV